MALQKTTSPSQNQESSTKRRRVGVACYQCRGRKIRCYGNRPTCAACSRGGHNCRYEPASQMVHVSRDYIAKLKQRAESNQLQEEPTGLPDPQVANRSLDGFPQIPGLDGVPATRTPSSVAADAESIRTLATTDGPNNEHRLALPPTMFWPGHTDRPNRQNVPTVEEQVPRREAIHFESRPHELHIPSGATPSSTEPPPRVGMPHDPHSSTNAPSRANVTAKVADVAGDSEDFHGDSSSLSFMQQIRRGMATSSSPESVSTSYSNLGTQSTSDLYQTCLRSLKARNGLPPKHIADEFVLSYFRHVHLLYPFLHWPTFEAQYRESYVSERMVHDDQWLALLSVVFALGVSFAHPFEDQSSLGDAFFGRAQKLMSTERLAKATLQTLQFCLLQCLYYQFTSRPNQNWHALGLAIRVATTIGAHVDPQASQHNVLQRELRRRCWYGCVVLDTMLALILGRPTALPSTFNVRPPVDLEDDDITAECYKQTPGRSPSRTAFFVQCVAMSGIMKDIQSTLYSPSIQWEMDSSQETQKASSPDFSEAIRLDKRLLDWYQQIPQHLRLDAKDDLGELKWIRNVLLTRFLNMRILIHRRFLSPSQALQGPASLHDTCLTSLEGALRALSVSVCRTSAVRQIDAVFENYNLGLPGAWWAEMNCLFTAATVLLALAHETEDSGHSTTLSQASFQKALAILREMQTQSATASSYVAQLQKALETGLYIQDEPPPPPPNTAAQRNNEPDYMDMGNPVGAYDLSFLYPTPSSWNMQNLFVEPWGLSLEDNPLPEPESFQL